MWKEKTLLLWDLDGTLTDPMEGITRSVQAALRAFGIDEPDRRRLCPFIGPPLLDSFREFYGFSEEEAARAVVKYREYFAETGIFENALYPGVPHVLETLAARGKTHVLATSKPSRVARADPHALRLVRLLHTDNRQQSGRHPERPRPRSSPMPSPSSRTQTPRRRS